MGRGLAGEVGEGRVVGQAGAAEQAGVVGAVAEGSEQPPLGGIEVEADEALEFLRDRNQEGLLRSDDLLPRIT